MHQIHSTFYVPGQEDAMNWTSRNVVRNAYIVGHREYIILIIYRDSVLCWCTTKIMYLDLSKQSTIWN